MFQYKSGPQAKILQMYTLLDEVMKSKGSLRHHKSSKRAQAADKLKLMFQEIVAENLDLKAASNNNSGIKGANNAGSMIDNFDLSLSAERKQFKSGEDRDVTSKIWSLESENQLLTSKLNDAIQDREKKTRDLKEVNQQILMLLKDLQPKSSTYPKEKETKKFQRRGTKKNFTVPSVDDDSSSHYSSNSKFTEENWVLRNAASAGFAEPKKKTPYGTLEQPKMIGDYNTGTQHHKAMSVGGKNSAAKGGHPLMAGGLESIESDREDEDM